MADVTLAQLLEAGVHFGHKAYRWNPKMFPYIYTERNNIHILDLVQSAQLLKEANSYLESASEKGKTFLCNVIQLTSNIFRKQITFLTAF